MTRPALHYAITAHGLGHFTRSMQILEALHEIRPDLELHVSTAVHAPWIRRGLKCPVHWRTVDYEPGAMQTNPFEVDVPATIAAYISFMSERADRLAREVDFLRTHNFVGVVVDCPALAVRAAGEVGLPAIGVSNFTWDWILEPWIDAESDQLELLRALRRDYAAGSDHLILPFGQRQSPFPRCEASVLIGRRATVPREAVRARLGVTGRAAVVSPGGWDGQGWAEVMARAGDLTLITIGDLPIRSGKPLISLPNNLPRGISFPDVLNAADVVVAKPGFGLASECLINRVPLVMIERPGFRETSALETEFARMGKHSLLSLADFFEGRWEGAIDAALGDQQTWIELGPNPERAIAARLLDLLRVARDTG